MTGGRALACALCALAAALAAPIGKAEDLYARGSWPALAADRTADRLGDALTIIVYETSEASNSARSSTRKARSLSGQIAGGASFSQSGQASLNGSADGSRQTGRSGTITAQLSVVVDAVLPNGDLHVTGQQLINVNGERTNIRIRGRVRRADIGAGNTVQSSRLADAEIDYDGTGFSNRKAKAGMADRVLSWLGLG